MSSVFILYPDPRLRAIATPRAPDVRLCAVGAMLLDAATAHNAYGLAGVHIGDVEPVVVISVGPPEIRDYRTMFNPEVVETAGPLAAGVEGSVSLPGIEVEVVRPNNATIAYDDENGARHTLALEGFAARVAQHEVEQMNGIFFLSHLSRLKRDAAIRRFEKLRRGQNLSLF